MIDKFRDHAANERTFLSWIRTAITISGLGIVLEKVLAFPKASWFAIALIGLSAALVILSLARFLLIRHQLNHEPQGDTNFGPLETLFALMLAALLAVVLVFLVRMLG